MANMWKAPLFPFPLPASHTLHFTQLTHTSTHSHSVLCARAKRRQLVLLCFVASFAEMARHKKQQQQQQRQEIKYSAQKATATTITTTATTTKAHTCTIYYICEHCRFILYECVCVCVFASWRCIKFVKQKKTAHKSNAIATTRHTFKNYADKE